MIVEPVPPAPVLDAMRAPLAAGAERADPPVLQPLGLYLDLLGEAMRARLFVVQREGGEDACLRPDFTVGVARDHLEGGKAAGRYAYEGPTFRAAPRGVARAEEFLQLGVERIGGEGGPEEDAEIAGLAVAATRAGGRDDLTLVMGDLALFEAFCKALGAPARVRARLTRRLGSVEAVRGELAPRAEEGGREDALAAALGDLDEARAAGVLEALWAAAGVTPAGGRSAAEIARRLAERRAPASPAWSERERGLIERWTRIAGEPEAVIEAASVLAREAGIDLNARLQGWARRASALAAVGVAPRDQRLELGFGRPFAYYDGFLFEVRSAALSEDAPPAAGGRYDGLLARLRPGASGTAIGCVVRPGRAWVDGEAS